eukprot:TRINITY_DN2867_c0_g1_i1.p1 TRINITY_DN2867_c0_g1~~TRINITY_DN2867_c0_g1_i1.p1  ORF type:complete len:643 (+),score=126.82 TRINITY_DN2867_c0_g1_i1:250-2178(+)
MLDSNEDYEQNWNDDDDGEMDDEERDENAHFDETDLNNEDDHLVLSQYYPAGYNEDSDTQSDEPCQPEAEAKDKSTTAHLYVFTAEKGGMKGFDKKLQQNVIEELSKGSKHLHHAKIMDERLTKRVETIKHDIAMLTDVQIRTARNKSEAMLNELELTRKTERWCCVIDMDMFFAAVAIKDNPSLENIPVAVGGNSMISTANYVARKYGVRSAMPGFIAKELCKRQGVTLTFVPHSTQRYKEEAKTVRDIISKYGPYSSMSLDEAKIDLTDIVRSRQASLLSQGHNADETHIAETVLSDLREEVYSATSLTVSGSVASNFMLAKIGADVNKPNGQFMVPRRTEDMLEWFHELPVRKIPGVGKVKERVLKEAYNVYLIKDILAKKALLHANEDGSSLPFLMRSALGIARDTLTDYTNAPKDSISRQSVGAERTFRDQSDQGELQKILMKLCEKVSEVLKRKDMQGRAVIVKLKRTDFKVLSKLTNSHSYLQSAEDIYNLAKPLLDKECPISCRLMGVKVQKFKRGVSYKVAKDITQKRLTSFMTKSEVEGEKRKTSTDSDDDVRVVGHCTKRPHTPRESTGKPVLKAPPGPAPAPSSKRRKENTREQAPQARLNFFKNSSFSKASTPLTPVNGTSKEDAIELE